VSRTQVVEGNETHIFIQQGTHKL